MRRFVTATAICAAGATVILSVGQSQSLPAPTVDRVGFPEDYQNRMQILYVFDRPDTRQVRTVYANEAAMSVRFGGQSNYPYGSIIVMETWRALQDRDGNPALDENGRYQKDPAASPTLFVMRKERGFGEAYQQNRNGEWEYVAYRPDGSHQTAPSNSAGCAVCHLQAGQGKDWVMRASLHFNGASGAVPNAVIKNYTFVPGTLRIQGGTTVTFYNDDVIEHTIVADEQGGLASPRLRGGSSFSINFPRSPGEWSFHCSIHPTMRGKIVVE